MGKQDETGKLDSSSIKIETEISSLLAGRHGSKRKFVLEYQLEPGFIKERARNTELHPNGVETVGRDEAGGKSLLLFF